MSNNASSGLQEGAELYRRSSASDVEYEDSSLNQQTPAIRGMADGADLYRRTDSKATD